MSLKQNKFLAIIPARGGSKRLPNKNILNLNGKPLISYSIEAGLKSNYINKVLVSSNSDEILDISKQFKSQTIKRPEHLATDTTTVFDTIKHVIENNEHFEYIVLLQPTSPLRTSKHIDEAIELLEEKDADAIISVCETEHSPLWANTLPQDGSFKGFMRDEILNKRSQDLEKYYRINGAVYICKISKLLEEKTLFLQDNIFAYKMEQIDSVDIDTKLDFLTAQVILENN
ncbi:MAG: acylneuraminate cytidylyltransferase family protein [Arcobacteraceae bacterium]|nr:acylneuraminate cytidylyltransferase family protein [Arcobacteraceae bacterium]